MFYNIASAHLNRSDILSEYYTRKILKQIASATDYKSLNSIGMNILMAMLHEHPFKPIAMICGPISTGGKGSRNENLKIFSRAIDRASAGGLFVFSQMPFENDMERIYKSNQNLQGTRLLEEFYLPMFNSGLIKLLCFIPDWEHSVGARWKHEQAEVLHIPRIDLSDKYILD